MVSSPFPRLFGCRRSRRGDTLAAIQLVAGVILLFAAMLVSTPLVSGALSDGLRYCWSLDDSDCTDDGPGGVDCTKNGADVVAGKLGNAYDYEKSQGDMSTITAQTLNKTMTYTVWVKMESIDTYAYVLADDGNNYMCNIYDTGSIEAWNGNSGTADTSTNWQTGQWYHIAFTQNGQGAKFYINGSDVTNDGGVADSNFVLNHFGDAGGTSWEFDGLIDEIKVWNRTLNASEILDDYNSHNGTTCTAALGGGGAASPAITVTALSPSDDYHTANATGGVRVSFNFTATALPGGNCTLMVNETGSFVERNRSSYTTNGSKTLKSAAAFVNETSYQWKVNCSQAGTTGTTTARTLVVDRTSPIWTLNAGNFFKSDNSTTIYPLIAGETASYDLKVSDTYMFAANVTIYGASCSGTAYHSFQETNLSAVDYNISETVNFTSMVSGTYCAARNASDDHTKKTIPPYGVTITSQLVSFLTGDGYTINIENMQGNLKAITTKKLDDRYTFTFNPNNNRKTWTFRVSCDAPLYKRGFYSYPTFVCSKGLSGSWVDFYTSSYLPGSLQTTRESPNTWLVTLTKGNDKLPVVFESIGGLNYKYNTNTFVLSRTPQQAENFTVDAYNETWISLSWDDHPEANATVLYRNDTEVYNGTAATFNDTGLDVYANYSYSLRSWYLDQGVYQYNLSSVSVMQQTSDHQFPNVTNVSFNDATPCIDEAMVVSVTCVDNEIVDRVTIQVTTPNNESSNTTDSTGPSYTRTYTPTIGDGPTYNVRAYCFDEYGNLNDTETGDFAPVTCNASGAGGGGGGGGGGGSSPAPPQYKGVNLEAYFGQYWSYVKPFFDWKINTPRTAGLYSLFSWADGILVLFDGKLLVAVYTWWLLILAVYLIFIRRY